MKFKYKLKWARFRFTVIVSFFFAGKLHVLASLLSELLKMLSVVFNEHNLNCSIQVSYNFWFGHDLFYHTKNSLMEWKCKCEVKLPILLRKSILSLRMMRTRVHKLKSRLQLMKVFIYIIIIKCTRLKIMK